MRYTTLSLALMLLLLAFTSSGCFIFRKRAACPANSEAATTGTKGKKGKAMPLFPKKMTKRK